MIPAAHAMRSLLALKLFGSARHSHVMSYVLDQGLALFAGLNVIPKRSHRQKGILAFLAQDAKTRVFCYANADLRKDTQNDQVLQIVEYWKKRPGRYPKELIFDSKLTTYQNLDKLNQLKN